MALSRRGYDFRGARAKRGAQTCSIKRMHFYVRRGLAAVVSYAMALACFRLKAKVSSLSVPRVIHCESTKRSKKTGIRSKAPLISPGRP